MFKNTFVSGFLSVFYSLGSDPLQLWGKRVGSASSSSSSSSAISRSRAGVSVDEEYSSSRTGKPTAATTGTTSTSISGSAPTDPTSPTSTTTAAATTTTTHAATTMAIEPHIEFIKDDTLNSQVLELLSPNLTSTFITCPALPTRTLGIKLPLLVFLVKNLGKYWSFEVVVMDDRGEKRRFRASNFQSVTRVKPYIVTMPLRMDPGWNQIQLNLADYTKRAFGTTYVETLRITIHANCRLRRVYFSDRVVPENELPAEFKLYLPVVNSS